MAPRPPAQSKKKSSSARGSTSKSAAGAPKRRKATPSRGKSPKSAPPKVAEGPQRLQKVLAAAGIASRRECEQLILEGRVEVGREVVTELGTKVDPAKQDIRVDGIPLKKTKLVYFAVYKPSGMISTSKDPWGRSRVIDMIPESLGRVFTVGRLDMASEGLILLTNDGELANRLAHPRYGVTKTYEVQIAGEASHDVLKSLREGVHIAEGFVRADSASFKRRHKKSSVLEIVLSEGKNREIRRMLARSGHRVQRLKRVALGPLKLGQMASGDVRMLSPAEIKRLRSTSKESAEAISKSAAPVKRRPSPAKHSTNQPRPRNSKPVSASKARSARKPRPTKR